MKLLRRLILLCKNSSKEVRAEVGKLLAEIGSPVLYVSSLNIATAQGTQNLSEA